MMCRIREEIKQRETALVYQMDNSINIYIGWVTATGKGNTLKENQEGVHKCKPGTWER